MASQERDGRGRGRPRVTGFAALPDLVPDLAVGLKPVVPPADHESPHFDDLDVLGKFQFCLGSGEREEDQATKIEYLEDFFKAALDVPKDERKVRITVLAPWDSQRKVTTGRADLIGFKNVAYLDTSDDDDNRPCLRIFDSSLLSNELSRGGLLGKADRVIPETESDRLERLICNVKYIDKLIGRAKDAGFARRDHTLTAYLGTGITPAVTSDQSEGLYLLKNIAVWNYLNAAMRMESRKLWRQGQLKPLFVVTEGDNNHVVLHMWDVFDRAKYLRYKGKNVSEYLVNSRDVHTTGISTKGLYSSWGVYKTDSTSPDSIAAAHSTYDLLTQQEVLDRTRDGIGGGISVLNGIVHRKIAS